MSGGFFRGTSADQDTRFSNKEAKLLKSQKFPAELDQLVDMNKVKMDVIRPWIANRTTEFLGFEDEVLINFIYGLLDGKEVDGKQIQIQLTGFMEKNTVKFMKELWGLLTSAQKNTTGIPQQFLDAKAEETRKKKAEEDRINNEIQKKKEEDRKEADQERQNRINADLESAKVAAAAAVSARASSGKASSKIIADDEIADEKRSSRARDKNGDLRMLHDGDRSPPSHRSVSSSPRSGSQTYSISRSQSRSPPMKRRHMSRSVSRSPRHRRRSPSPIRRPRSPIYSPPRRKRSPLYDRSPRRRSPSPWRRRPLSPRRRRSPSPPRRRRSPSPPPKRRSPSPLPRRRSPPPHRRRSPSPPPKRRSPSPPLKRRSPSPPPKRRSPLPPPKRRSPPLPSRRSPSPLIRMRPPAPRSPVYHRQSPVRSPRRRRMDSQSPPHWQKSRSPHQRTKRSLSREHGGRSSEVDPRRYRDRNASERTRVKRFTDHKHVVREENEGERRELPRAGGQTVVESPVYRQSLPIHPRSPQRDLRMRSEGTSNMLDSPLAYQSSPNQSPSPQRVLMTHMNEEKRLLSPHHRQMGRAHERGSPNESPEPRKKPEQNTRVIVEVPSRRDVKAPHVLERKEYGPRRSVHDRDIPTDLLLNRSGEKRGRHEGYEPKRKEYHTLSGDNVDRSLDYPQRRSDNQTSYPSEGLEYGPGILGHGQSLPVYSDNRSGVNRPSIVLQSHIEYDDEEDAVGLRRSSSRDSHADDDSDTFKVDAVRKLIPKPEPIKQMAGSDSEENDGYRRKHVEKRKAKREEIASKIMDDDEDGTMSPRREAKRRKKEEKRLRKEEKRKRREERHRRKEERRASKAKAKALATVATPERDSAAEDSEDDCHDRDHSHQSHDEEMEDEQKRLEIELRRKALESLRAKKAISH